MGVFGTVKADIGKRHAIRVEVKPKTIGDRTSERPHAYVRWHPNFGLVKPFMAQANLIPTV